MNQTDLFPYSGRSFVVNYGEGLVFRNTMPMTAQPLRPNSLRARKQAPK